MLRFIVGRAASGKTYYTVKSAAECLKKGESPVVLVPEQFSFECEKQVLAQAGDSLSQNINVLSFSRIYDEVNRITGGVCVSPLGNADKLIIMKKAIKNVSGELKIFGKYASSSGFAKKMNETVTEFKLNAVSPDELIDAAEALNDGTLKAKLYDTAAIIKSYDLAVEERFIDPADMLEVLYNKLENFRFFEGKTVFIDSFDGFTGEQYRIIDRIMSQSKDVFVTLNADNGDKKEYGVFANVNRMKAKITDIAKKHSVKIESDILLPDGRYENESLSVVEKFLYCGQCDKEELSGVTVCHADTVYDEAEFVARNIRRTVREKGARYKDFLVCARETEPYAYALKNAMHKNGVPCFIDSRTPLASTPMAATVSAAAELISGVTSEKIFKLYKSGLKVFTPEELGTLENYVYIWDIDGKQWFNAWDMNPDGFSTDKSDEAALKNINELRERAIAPIVKMRKNSPKTAKETVLGIMMLLDTTGAAEAYLQLYNEYKQKGDTVYADVIRQSYDMVIGVFNSIVAAFGEDEIKSAEFCDALKTSLSVETVGSVPQSLDEVTFGSADRIRPSRPKYVYIIGANQNVFPKSTSVTGVFTVGDRFKLSELGIDIPDKTVYESVYEDYLVYSSVCCGSKELYISYTSTLSDGSKGECSPFLTELCEAFGIKLVREPKTLEKDNLPETLESGFSDYCRSVADNDFNAANIFEAVKNFEDENAKVKRLSSLKERPDFKVSAENMEKLFGKKIYMSASKFDNYSRCRFRYFCNDVLKVRSLNKSDFNVMQKGTIVHFVLESIIKQYGKKLSELKREEISSAVDGYLNEYLDMVEGYSSCVIPRFKYIVYTMSRSIKTVVEHIAEEFKNCDFEPVACELEISDNESGEIPALKIPLDNGAELTLTGKVDRVDGYKGYVRIIDYKTGSRTFQLPDIVVGQNMQMLIYLYAVCNSGKYGGNPAGILYLQAKRENNNKSKIGKMSGLIVDDGDIAAAMDRSGSGRFVPKHDGRNKNSYLKEEDFGKIFGYIEKRLKSCGNNVLDGKIFVNPTDGKEDKACKYCDYKYICRIEDKDIESVKSNGKDAVINEIEGWERDEL